MIVCAGLGWGGLKAVEWWLRSGRKAFKACSGFQVKRRLDHWWKIRELKKQHCKKISHPSTGLRAFCLVAVAAVVVGFWYILLYMALLGGPTWKELLMKYQGLYFLATAITSPVFFVVWLFRDRNRLIELANTRKDVNLKEFQKLQFWATGNIEIADLRSLEETSAASHPGKEASAAPKEGEAAAAHSPAAQKPLQISALHQLRAFLRGEYGDSFRRASFEIFAAVLKSTHQSIIARLRISTTKITRLQVHKEIEQDPLAQQINRIAQEEWFNLLINHDFPLATLSLTAANLSGTYLRNRDFPKGVSLVKVDLRWANLREAHFEGADLRYADLEGADLREAHFEGADLCGTDLRGSFARKVKLPQLRIFAERIKARVGKVAAFMEGGGFWESQKQYFAARRNIVDC